MAEISLDDFLQNTPGQPPLPARPLICLGQEVLNHGRTPRLPHKAPELFVYQASIVRLECNFMDRWVAYNWCYHREALAQKNLDWSIPNARLYNKAFTGRCSFCLQEDHLSQACPRNQNRPWFGWLQDTNIPGQAEEETVKYGTGRQQAGAGAANLPQVQQVQWRLQVWKGLPVPAYLQCMPRVPPCLTLQGGQGGRWPLDQAFPMRSRGLPPSLICSH